MHLSKSRYVSGLRCPLCLWLAAYHPEFGVLTPEAEFATGRGHRVGVLARTCFPGGHLLDFDYREHDAAVKETAAKMRDPGCPTLFEAAFTAGNIKIRADVLEPLPGKKWRLLEVKAASSVGSHHVNDLAVQHWVIRQSGVALKESRLMHIDTAYVLRGDLDLDRLFVRKDPGHELDAALEALPGNLQRQFQILNDAQPPQVEMGQHCHKPWSCPYLDHCNSRCTRLSNPVSDLPGIRQPKVKALAEQGVLSIEEIPDDFPLSENQARVRDCVKRGRDYVSAGLKSALAAIKAPIHYLDFETFMPAVPLFQETRPYQQIPFQWSCHVESASGKLKHHEFLHDGEDDPRLAFIWSLLKTLGTKGSIVVYSHFERTMLNQLCEAFPDSAPGLKALMDRFIDLHEIVSHHYYTQAFHGSFSLKSVLPALVPELSYNEMAIGNGLEAMNAYEVLRVEEDDEKRARMREYFLKYCGLDTLAMVEVRRALVERVVKSGG